MANITYEGSSIDHAELSINYAIDFLEAVNSSEYCEFVQCLKIEDKEVIVFDADIERPQYPVHPVEPVERVAVVFYPDEDNIPRVYALRDNFPHVPHTNIYKKEFPRWLCIYEESFDELKLKWSGVTFLEDIRRWFADTAKGQLHANDQALESLLMPNSKLLILSRKYILESLRSKPAPASLFKITPADNIEIFFLKQGKYNAEPFAVLFLEGEPQKHGLIRKIPSNLFELHEFLKSANIDLLKCLEENFNEWRIDPELKGIIEASLLILVELPTKRDDTSEPERFETYAYAIHEKVKTIGVKIGIWDFTPAGEPGILFGGKDMSKNGEDVVGELLNPIFSFDKFTARITSGLDFKQQDKIVTAIGSGAIGSQVFMNLMRMGVGMWFLVDKDLVYPHNLARSAFFTEDVGHYKVEQLAQKANKLFDLTLATTITANALNPKEKAEELKVAYGTSDVILDMSASIPVARKIALDVDSKAKRISAFLTPTGNDCVLLSEDQERKISLDYLEMIYYRLIASESELEEHLKRPDERIRLGNSCRDVSFKLPQDLVGLHSGILTRAIREAVDCETAQIRVWKTNIERTVSVKEYTCPISKVYYSKTGEWTVAIDDYLLNKLSELRQSKLPNETGGVLLGSYDKLRKICYIVDTIPSPIDSIEWPTVYIRGVKGLDNDIRRVAKATDDNLGYIGEWHSHPKGASCAPSKDDFKAFTWLTDVMATYDLPALMIIVSEEKGVYLGQMIQGKKKKL